MKFKILILFTVLVISKTSVASDTVIIKTSAQCNSCKIRLESRMVNLKGVLSSNLNIESKELIVVYDKELVSTPEIENKVTEIGYDANNKVAKKAAYKRLPACCRKDYKGKH